MEGDFELLTREEFESQLTASRPAYFVLWSEEFVTANDKAALKHAWQFVDPHDIELWSGARLVGRLKPENAHPTRRRKLDTPPCCSRDSTSAAAIRWLASP